MKKAVVTLCIGDGWNEMAKITHPLIKEYADKLKSDFIIINSISEQIKESIDVGFQKYQLLEILEVYDRVLYIDTDIIVKRDCPDLFSIVPEDSLGAFDESAYALYCDEVNHQRRIIGVQEMLEWIGWVKQYINTGVLVLSKKHKEIFNLKFGQLVDLREQSQLNFNIKLFGFWVYDIGRRFNCMDFLNPNERFDSYLLHYAGKGFTPKWHNLPLKIEKMKEDLKILYG